MAAPPASPSEANPKPAQVATLAGYAVAAFGFLSAGSGDAKALETVTLWSVGFLGVISFVRHSILHASDAARMGWDIGRRNNFQIEVGMANLSWGLVAIAAVAWDWGTTAYAAITLVFALYLAQAFALHVISILEGSETRSGHSAHFGAALTAAMAAALAYYAISGLSDVDARPF